MNATHPITLILQKVFWTDKRSGLPTRPQRKAPVPDFVDETTSAPQALDAGALIASLETEILIDLVEDVIKPEPTRPAPNLEPWLADLLVARTTLREEGCDPSTWWMANVRLNAHELADFLLDSGRVDEVPSCRERVLETASRDALDRFHARDREALMLDQEPTLTTGHNPASP